MKVNAIFKMLCFAYLISFPVTNLIAAKIRVLIIDGHNNHNWRLTTPVLKGELEATGLFDVAVATAPQSEDEMRNYDPDFSKYDVVVSNYTDFDNGGKWSAITKKRFVKYVSSGGGFVAIHAALSAFPHWKTYNEIIGLGGWGGRDGQWGPYVYFQDGREKKDNSPGTAGHHGKLHPYLIIIRNKDNPITRGLPHEWMHVKDELYDSLRGPAKNLTVLATAYSSPTTGGSGRDEPVLFTVRYGKGRVFCTTLGHDVAAMNGVGFATTFQRGTQWAAVGRVTQKVPQDFPTASEVSTEK